MATILPDDYRMATPAPACPHGTSYAQPCYSCGWTCPSCRRSYAPWVRECTYQHAAASQQRNPFSSAGGAPVPMAVLALPPEMAEPGHSRMFRAGRAWQEVFPDLECRLSCFGGGNDDAWAAVEFRLKPQTEE